MTHVLHSKVYWGSEMHRHCTGTYQRSFSTASAGFGSKLTSEKRCLSCCAANVLSAVNVLLMCTI